MSTSFATCTLPLRSFCLVAILCCALALLCSDILTKYLAHAHFTMGMHHKPDIDVWHNLWGIDFAITYVPNRGAAWGWLSDWQYPLLVLRIATVLALIAYLCYAEMSMMRRLLLTLVAAGAIGNIFDTFVYGYVVDIFLFTFWGYEFAVFNIADSAITLGVSILILQAFIESRRRQHV